MAKVYSQHCIDDKDEKFRRKLKVKIVHITLIILALSHKYLANHGRSLLPFSAKVTSSLHKNKRNWSYYSDPYVP